MRRDGSGPHYGAPVPDFDERFPGTDLDPAVWTASYLPAWSSRAKSAATYAVGGGALRLSIPPEQGLWCPDLHETPLRVSAVQSANRSGPIGSTDGQQPFRDGLLVREEQPTVLGFTPFHGHVAVSCRAALSPRSMFSAWLVGLEDRPERCGEICVVEIFGDALATDADRRPTARYGCGVHAFRDPDLVEDFAAPTVALDVARTHTYAMTWTADGVDFLLDGALVRSTTQSPGYPLLLILGLFDFPDRATAAQRDGEPPPTPELVVERVWGQPPA
ncbi:MAG: hypothetical protein QOK35_528 [Pseudonocardiales bacterium]|jgi:hypothetical protein|nr:hypothetical protein [Pseudonocardiales bacterium]